jgi:hypothetical protein
VLFWLCKQKGIKIPDLLWLAHIKISNNVIALACFCMHNVLSKNMPRFLTNEALITIVPSKDRQHSENSFSLPNIISKLQRVQNTAARLITRGKNMITLHQLSCLFTGFRCSIVSNTNYYYTFSKLLWCTIDYFRYCEFENSMTL